MRNMVMVLFALLLTAGCSAPLAVFRLSDDVSMAVYSMHADHDGFEVKVKFRESTVYPEVIQEGVLPTRATFVEKFPADDETFMDRHHAYGLAAHAISSRTMTVYVGETRGTDDTWLGFAMLPQNLDGSVVTNTDPKKFNAQYTRSHAITGRIVRAGTSRGVWSLHWSPHRLLLRTDSGSLLWSQGTYQRLSGK